MSASRQMALGGMLTAVAVVIMCMGSIIPVNTYICPVLCIAVNRIVLERCGRRLGWCYSLAVAVLSLLLAFRFELISLVPLVLKARAQTRNIYPLFWMFNLLTADLGTSWYQ